jgi:plasmid stability protein
MKTTIDLPDNLVRAVKIRAAQQGRTVRELVAEYIQSGLNAPVQPTHAAHDLPIIPADAQAPLAQMSRDEIVALEYHTLASENADAP